MSVKRKLGSEEIIGCHLRLLIEVCLFPPITTQIKVTYDDENTFGPIEIALQVKKTPL